MSKRMWSMVACVVVVGVVASGVSVATASSTTGGEVIRVDAITRAYAHNDFDGDGRFDMGDRTVVRGPLVDPATGDDAGQVFWDCIAMTMVRFEPQQHGTWLCTALLRLAGGDLTLEGRDPAGYGASVFAVTGGTGQYRNARGEAEVVDVPDPDRTELTIHLEV